MVFQMCLTGLLNPTLSQKQVYRYLDRPNGNNLHLNYFIFLDSICFNTFYLRSMYTFTGGFESKWHCLQHG
jgi:hypothetical protein